MIVALFLAWHWRRGLWRAALLLVACWVLLWVCLLAIGFLGVGEDQPAQGRTTTQHERGQR